MTDLQDGSGSDRELVRAYVEQGSAEAFAVLTRRYSRLIYTVCLRETGEAALAEDCSQSVLLLLCQRSRSLADRDSLAGWLYAASRNLSRNARRQESRRRQAEVTSMMPSNANVPTERDNTLWDEIEPHFHQVLDRLRSDEREAVLLRFVNDQSLLELASCFGISENTARMRVSRALEKIRRHLRHVGVVVGVAALAALMEEHSAMAVPKAVGERLLTISATRAAARSGPGRPLPRAKPIAANKPSLVVFGLAGTLVLAVSGCFIINAIRHRPLGDAEQRRFFASMTGDWHGALEFVDDRSGRRFGYPTSVTLAVQAQGFTRKESLILTAKYTGSDRVDETTFAQQPDGMHLVAHNGGPGSSHSLDYSGVLTLAGPGNFVLEGVNAANTRQTRIEFSMAGRDLNIREQYRTAPFSTFQKYELRNRFMLQR